ncbi:pentapeptide repeat protein [Lachnotalea glycerini]|uniref:Pentapeptide repeat protein n=1 Tax=Lachnotalea glycerini TaxID=1763509 RepID=A0A318EMR8_9FIRM|nr:pentapeptide repeat-containing protein [Lachnotalea glycerini]PXV91231.1 pentapeptide repeat protein [Lachnotalea glycerini]
MGNSCIEMFEETFYPKAFLNLTNKTIEAFEERLEETIEQLNDKMKNYFLGLCNLQKERLAPKVSEINISFLYTSGLCGEPKFRIDSYGEGGRLISESVFTEELSADWLYAYVEEFTQELYEYTLTESIRRFVRPAELEVLKLRAVRSLLYYFSSRFRYIIPDILDYKQMAKIKKDESFVISMGEYMDWQKTTYAILPEVDLFNCEQNTVLSFRRFAAFYYQDKRFSGLKMNSARFMDCTFTCSVIEDCVMNDCVFSNCVFENMTIKNTKMIGCLFLDCTIKNSVWDEVVFDLEEPKEDETQYYEPAEFYRCDLKESQFKECILSYCSTNECDMEQVTIDGGRTEYSGFLEKDEILWLNGQGE